ncbi:hypothetical protein M6D81_31425 [Paenibacillus sp. J5C_2022]|uniref:hypothetical protein n=1 Tax=Paenibacillus sp. J5C2022 TaxID=2977129 RepID=UPI0021D10D52|nr:hypothetical protein [Paenibacillus sp. J5C2022]MCU6713218.1 hypothetical protein [Paenibacillus sp. J5C2022]
MPNFVDVLIEECKKKVERHTGEICTTDAAWRELDRVFKKSEILRQNKCKILKGYEKSRKYRISRNSAIALGIALEFQIFEMNSFLSKAGYALSDYHEEDILIINIMSTEKYTVSDVNEALQESGYAALTYRMSNEDLPKV